jgi:hypothetical protein
MLCGEGETVNEAWDNAVEQFSADPGEPMETTEIEDKNLQGKVK